MRWAIAVILSSVGVYMWGFAFYTQSKLPEKTILEVEEQAEAGEMLRDYFPKNGVYFFPNMSHDTQELENLHEAGPVAIVHMRNVDGSKMMDTGMMISGFCHTMLTCIFLCMLLGLVNRGLSGWFARIGFFIFVGFVCAFYSQVGSAVWWQFSWPFQLVNALHDWVAISIAGFVIATIAPYPKKRT